MNDPLRNRYLVSGLVFILFSLSFLFIKMEKTVEKVLSTDTKVFRIEARAGGIQRELNSSKKGIDKVNRDVNMFNRQIDVLIEEANAINKSIVLFMNNSDADAETLDSLKILEDEIMIREQQVDSLSAIFEERSNVLLSMMNEYNDKDTELSISRNEAECLHKENRVGKLTFLVYLLFSVLGISAGCVFMFRGLKAKIPNN